MKSIIKLTALLFVLQLGACKDEKESGTDVKTKMLTAESWGNAQVTHTPDGDLSDQYTNFAIVFTSNASDGFDGTFVVSNGGYAFSENAGKWKFSNDLDQIIFDSGKVIDFQLDETHLELDFIVPTPGGRVSGISGHFIFDLQPL
jgi:hypothetical protein